MKKMTEYIVAGVLADNKEVFLKRVGEMLEKKGLLEFLTDGVPVAVRIVDEEELMKSCLKEINKKIVEVQDVTISPDFHLNIEYKHVYETKYFKTMEDKESWEKDSYYFKGEKSDKMTEGFTIEGKRYSVSYCERNIDQIKGIEVFYV